MSNLQDGAKALAVAKLNAKAGRKACRVMRRLMAETLEAGLDKRMVKDAAGHIKTATEAFKIAQSALLQAHGCLADARDQATARNGTDPVAEIPFTPEE